MTCRRKQTCFFLHFPSLPPSALPVLLLLPHRFARNKNHKWQSAGIRIELTAAFLDKDSDRGVPSGPHHQRQLSDLDLVPPPISTRGGLGNTAPGLDVAVFFLFSGNFFLGHLFASFFTAPFHSARPNEESFY